MENLEVIIDHVVFEPIVGTTIDTACKEAHELLISGDGDSISFKFNDQIVTVERSDTNGELASASYMAECDRRRAEYLSSPEYAEAREKAKRRQMEQDLLLAVSLGRSPEKMTLKEGSEEDWAKTVEINSDGYGSGVIRFAERWARLMEGRLAAGITVENCADECSRTADNEGITGFMYGCAVGILSKVWAHGEELRSWHNLKTQIGTEGEKANENGGVLNPALLSIG